MGYYPISGREKLRESYLPLRAQLAEGAVALDRFVGWQGGGGRFEIYWRPEHRYWVLPNDSQEESRYWICVGLEDPTEYDNLTITCEINPSKDGSNRQTGGRLIRDDKQQLYLAHTGKVGGGRKGIGKDAFSKWYGGIQRRIRAADGALEDLIILGRIGDPALIASIGEFARKVADFKVEVTGSDVRR
jgi:hypothetical protein